MKKNKMLMLVLGLFFYGQTFCQNLVVNGNFINGNTGFTISAELPNNMVCDQESYAVVSSTAAQKCGGIFSPLPGINDNSYLVIDGFETAPLDNIIWEQTIPVTSGVHSFSMNLAGVTNGRMPNLEVSINGVVLMNITSDNIPFNRWARFSSSWLANVGTSSANIIIRQLSPYSGSDYDFAIENIILEAGCSSALSANFSYEFNPCTGVVNFFATDPNATSWSWDFGDGTTSTLQNPSHTFTGSPLPTGANGPGIWLTVGDVNQCVAAVHASDLYFYTKNDGLSGINLYSNGGSTLYQYDADINESAIYTGSGSSYCRTDFPQVIRGASTMDQVGNYYYLEGNNISKVNELPCTASASNLTYSNINGTGAYENIGEYPYHVEPEYGFGNEIWVLSYDDAGNYQLKEVIPSFAGVQNLSEVSRIGRTINIGNLPHVEGSSTFNPVLGKYYYVLDAPLPVSVNDNPIIGTVVEIDVYTETVRTFDVKDMDGVDAAGTPYRLPAAVTITPVLQELEYNSTSGKIIATVEHYVEEIKYIGQTPGGPGGPGGSGGPGDEHINLNGNSNNGGPVLQNSTSTVELDNNGGPVTVVSYKITTVSTDVISFSVPNASITNAYIVATGVSYDNLSSSTLDLEGQRYLLTSNNGFYLYQVDLSSGVVSLQTGASPTDAKDVRLIYEIEDINCGAVVTSGKKIAPINPSLVNNREEKTITSDFELEANVTSIKASVYPNPTSTGEFTIAVEQNDMSSNETLLIEVLDVYGKVLQRVEQVDNMTNINISDYAKGMYFLRVSCGTKTETRKLIYR